MGGIARYKTASPNRELLYPKGLRKSADPPARDRIGEHPPSNQSPTSAFQGFCRNLPGKRNGPRGSRIGHHRLQSSRHTHSPWLQTHPLNPAASGFRNPRQLGTFTNSCAEPKIAPIFRQPRSAKVRSAKTSTMRSSSVRRGEMLGHVILFNETRLRRLVREYLGYNHADRIHQGSRSE